MLLLLVGCATTQGAERVGAEDCEKWANYVPAGCEDYFYAKKQRQEILDAAQMESLVRMAALEELTKSHPRAACLVRAKTRYDACMGDELARLTLMNFSEANYPADKNLCHNDFEVSSTMCSAMTSQ